MAFTAQLVVFCFLLRFKAAPEWLDARPATGFLSNFWLSFLFFRLHERIFGRRPKETRPTTARRGTRVVFFCCFVLDFFLLTVVVVVVVVVVVL